MDITTAAGAVSTVAQDLIMTAVLLFVWIASSWYLTKVIRAIIRDYRAQIEQLTNQHRDEMKVIIEKHAELNEQLIDVLKENQDYISQNTGILYRLEAQSSVITSVLTQKKNG